MIYNVLSEEAARSAGVEEAIENVSERTLFLYYANAFRSAFAAFQLY